MSSAAEKKIGEPSEVMAAIAELRLELSKQIKESFTSLEARVKALEERSGTLEARVKTLEDKAGALGGDGTLHPPAALSKLSQLPQRSQTKLFAQQQPPPMLAKFLHVKKDLSLQLATAIKQDKPAEQTAVLHIVETIYGLAQEEHIIDMSRIKLHVPLEVAVVLKQFAAALSHLYEEAMVRKDMLCSNVTHRQRQDISSTWGYEGLQPWPPPCSLRTSCLSGKGVMLWTKDLATGEEINSVSEGSSVMGRFCSRT